MRLRVASLCFVLAACETGPVSLGDYVPSDSGPLDLGVAPDAAIDAGHIGPELIATSSVVTFVPSLINCRKTAAVSFESVSAKFLTLSEIRLDGPSNFEVASPQLPLTIIPGETFELEVAFTATSSLASLSAILHLVYESPHQTGNIEVIIKGQGQDTVPFEARFTQKSRPEIDFLFVLDQSCSMHNNITLLQNQIGKVDAYIRGASVDFHIGLTNMDSSDTGAQGRLLGEPAIIDESTLNYTSVFRQRLRTASVAPFETGLQSSWLALSEPIVSAENIGFLRESSALAIYYLSDEEDQSSRSLADYAEDLASLRPPGMISIRAIVGTSDMPSCGAMRGDRYLALVEQIGGASSSICDSDWDDALIRFPRNFGLNSEFMLMHSAAGAQLDVIINDRIDTNWQLKEDKKTLVSSSTIPPDRGSMIVVKYQIDECLAP